MEYNTCDGQASGSKCCLAAEGLCEEPADPVKACSGGLNNNKSCAGQFCVNGICELKTNISDLGHYRLDLNDNGWGLPTDICERSLRNERVPMTTRSNDVADYKNTNQDYCAIPPVVDNDLNAANGNNIKVNSSLTDVTLIKNGFVNLTFNTKVDSQQLPLVRYSVDWGDGGKTMVTGVEMRDKPNPDNPESVYHLYSYWDLKAKANSGIIAASSCSVPGECRVQPKIQIKDNWGWCNHGVNINVCGNTTPAPNGQWDSFAGWVVVKEKQELGIRNNE